MEVVGWFVGWLVGRSVCWLAGLIGRSVCLFVCVLISIKNEVPVTCSIAVEIITININFVGRSSAKGSHERGYCATC